ncbi:MAG: 3-phosphoshikimate 1-carboxyvinyltransferase [Clostridioides sp.]|nr:3-phosphoshikimate 1-carboxyvinyltransferase [Clostridioides sp.]
MNIKIKKSELNGTVKIIPSKSDAHRLMIAAALSDKPTKIILDGWSKDIEATKNCLESLGCKIKCEEYGFEVIPIEDIILNSNFVLNDDNNLVLDDDDDNNNLVLDCVDNNNLVLDCVESGSTLRFLVPIVAALGKNVTFEGRGKLPERPIDTLVDELKKHGSLIEYDFGISESYNINKYTSIEPRNKRFLPLKISGHLTGGVYNLAGNISSQFITGLLFALPLLEEDSEIHLTTKIESQGYIDMTLKTLKDFNIEIQKTDYGFFIKGGQKYISPEKIYVEGDWSGAAFWIASGAICGDISCAGLLKDSCQGDREIINLMKRFGANVKWHDNIVRISGGNLKGIDIDASQIPDLVPALCVVASFSKGTTTIYNAGRLRIKESDRLDAMATNLRKLGVNVVEDQDSITIEGMATKQNNKLRDNTIILDSYNDHRIVMSLAIASSILESDVIIEGAEAVSKSYPTFFEEFNKLGGIANVL